jgi:hypothetical protein
MGTIHRAMVGDLIAWGLVTLALVIVLMYRSRLESREEDQPYLDPAEQSLADEQRTVVERIRRLTRPLRILFSASAMLLLVAVGLWFWQGLNS